jgi:hypothetical protein
VNNATQINRHQRVREEVKISNLSLRRIPGVMILEVKKCRRKLLIRFIMYIVIIARLAERLGESIDR